MFLWSKLSGLRRNLLPLQWRRTMCRIFEEYGDERVAERNIELVEKLLRDGSFSIKKISAITDVPLEQVRQIAQKLAVTV